MPASDRLNPALAGLADMDRGLVVSVGGARMAAADPDLPMAVAPSLREAVKAVEYARKKVAEALQGVQAAKKAQEKRDAP